MILLLFLFLKYEKNNLDFFFLYLLKNIFILKYEYFCG